MPDQHMTIHKDGRTITIDTDEDGDRTVTTAGTDQATGTPALTTSHVGQPARVAVRHHELPFGEAFTMGIVTGVLLVLASKAWRRRWLHQPDPQIADVSRNEVAALAARTTTLEQIVTDPATRTAREIDALR